LCLKGLGAGWVAAACVVVVCVLSHGNIIALFVYNVIALFVYSDDDAQSHANLA